MTPSAPRPHVKVCGLTRVEDALLALELGATYLGLIFAEGTPRCLSECDAAGLLAEVRARASAPVRPVGVFVHEPPAAISFLAEHLGLAAVQLHDSRTADSLRLGIPTWRAVQVRGPESLAEVQSAVSAGTVVLDAFAPGKHGGTGRTFDHSLVDPYLDRGRVFIAGGLNPDNITEVAGRFTETGRQPYGYDVSSGLEAEPRIKDHAKMRAFFSALAGACGP